MSGLGFLSADEIRSYMASKRTRVVLAADHRTTSEISHTLSQAGPSICMLKTHVDGVMDFEYSRWMDEVVLPAREMDILILRIENLPISGTFLGSKCWVTRE